MGFVHCNIIFLASAMIAVLTASATAQNAPISRAAGPGVMTVVIDGARSADGNFKIAVCGDAACYENDGPFVVKADQPAALNPVEFRLSGLPEGEYSVVLHHDEDADDVFDKFLFLPEEGYGFSNDAEPSLGRPPFYAVAVTLGSDDLTVPITVQS